MINAWLNLKFNLSFFSERSNSSYFATTFLLCKPVNISQKFFVKQTYLIYLSIWQETLTLIGFLSTANEGRTCLEVSLSSNDSLWNVQSTPRFPQQIWSYHNQTPETVFFHCFLFHSLISANDYKTLTRDETICSGHTTTASKIGYLIPGLSSGICSKFSYFSTEIVSPCSFPFYFVLLFLIGIIITRFTTISSSTRM